MMPLAGPWGSPSPLDQASIGLVLLIATSLGAAIWVWRDIRVRFPRRHVETWAWLWEALLVGGTLVALPIFLPMYLLGARPVGAVTACPPCGRGTLSHRATCLHCGHPIAFEAPPASWGLGEVVGVVIAITVSLRVIAEAAGLNDMPPFTVLTVIGVAQNALFVLLVAYIVRGRYHQPLAAIGLTPQRWPWWSAVGVLAGAVMIPVSVAAERAAILVIGFFLGTARAEAIAANESANDILATVLRTPRSSLEVAWLLVLLCVLVPIGEEVFFRGFIYGTLRRWGWVWAVTLSSVLFAAVHLQVVHFLPILLLGVVLAVLYQRTESLVASMAVHGVNNLIAALASLYNWNI
ncbi:MAG TPA: CPBP family intramembrane glutamic endopeptidase [bacterium]|nr:CPBP family intramembrane glutamic endopeptidase [bacterium]